MIAVCIGNASRANADNSAKMKMNYLNYRPGFRSCILSCGEERRHSEQLCHGLIGRWEQKEKDEGFSWKLGVGFLCVASWLSAQVFYINRTLPSL